MAILSLILSYGSTKLVFIDVSCIESRRHRQRFSLLVRSLCSSLRASGEKLSPTVFDTTSKSVRIWTYNMVGIKAPGGASVRIRLMAI